jgi:ATP-dependent DNA helicase RecG|tara:strand:- start:8805 stop:10859 length:2055 start_codon:yes stop_codon:yes gene_type:complete
MKILKNKNFLFQKINTVKGIGPKLTKYLKIKNIEKISDLIWSLPYSFTDRSNIVTLDKLEIGKIATIKVKPTKYNFPRLRNLPNKIVCEDEVGKIDIIFFNSREGYIKKVLPLNNWVIISGKINFYKRKYQITNPEYITTLDKLNYVGQNIPKYSLTEGLNEKTYRKIVNTVINNLPEIDEWYGVEVLKKLNFKSWNESIKKIHYSEKDRDLTSKYYKRLAFDEIVSNLIILSKNRIKIKKTKKNRKIFNSFISNNIIKKLKFKLTSDQIKVIDEINLDLSSNQRMFRILQGDVGSGKTIISLITLANVIESGYQGSLMAPTDILAKQHYKLAKKLFEKTSVSVEFLSGKTEYKNRKNILDKLVKGKIDLLIGTHSLFQKKILFKNLGFVVIDEQHKFGVKQRMNFAEKGGKECDVLLMSATPIPRTMVLATYGDMDISKLIVKPKDRLPIITYSKPENKITEIISYIKKQIKLGNQVFWVCPLIKESKFLNYSSVKKRYDWLIKKFPNITGLLHGEIDKIEKEKILKKFLENKIKILVSTSVIEVGIDFPNANLIIIENANKFGLAQLHQLRGRVGRGTKQGICILLYKDNLSKNSIKRIKILKKSNDGFLIAEEDMKLRGFGDILGFQQSGLKYFRLADPVIHSDLFELADNYIKKLNEKDFNRYTTLLKLFDKAEITNLES